MRILFWLAAVMSFLSYSFAIAHLLGLSAAEAGDSEDLFIPLLGAGIIGGFIANSARRFKPEEMKKNENAAGIILSMMTGIAAMVVILAFIGVF